MSGRWVYLREAAELLGASTEAIRKRSLRGTIRSRKDQDGRVLVWVEDQEDNCQFQGEAETYRELIEELRDRVRSLEDANRENSRIIAALTQRIIPELEVPQEPRESPTEAAEPSGRETPQELERRADSEKIGRGRPHKFTDFTDVELASALNSSPESILSELGHIEDEGAFWVAVDWYFEVRHRKSAKEAAAIIRRWRRGRELADRVEEKLRHARRPRWRRWLGR